MNLFLILALALAWLAILAGCWPGWQLLRQNGRLLLRLEALEQRLDELTFDEPSSSQREEADSPDSQPSTLNSQPEAQSLVTSAATNRFGKRSLVRSKIKRDGLKAGTPAPDFRLPRLDGPRGV